MVFTFGKLTDSKDVPLLLPVGFEFANAYSSTVSTFGKEMLVTLASP